MKRAEILWAKKFSLKSFCASVIDATFEQVCKMVKSVDSMGTQVKSLLKCYIWYEEAKALHLGSCFVSGNFAFNMSWRMRTVGLIPFFIFLKFFIKGKSYRKATCIELWCSPLLRNHNATLLRLNLEVKTTREKQIIFLSSDSFVVHQIPLLTSRCHLWRRNHKKIFCARSACESVCAGTHAQSYMHVHVDMHPYVSMYHVGSYACTCMHIAKWKRPMILHIRIVLEGNFWCP